MMEVLAEAILSRQLPYVQPHQHQEQEWQLGGRGFDISFTWDHKEDIEQNVLHTVDQDTKLDMASVVEEGGGSILSRPALGDVVPCELRLSSWSGCHFEMVSVVSESRHVELYVDDAYETTSKGERLDASLDVLYTHQLAPQNQMAERLTLKFLSLGTKDSMKIQAVVVGVSRQTMAPQRRVSSSSSTDMDSVRDLIKSMNVEVGSGAEKLMNDIKSQQLNQKQMMFQQLMQNGNSSQQPRNHRNGNNENNSMMPNLLSQFQSMLTSPGLNGLMSGLNLPQEQQQQHQQQQQHLPRSCIASDTHSQWNDNSSSMNDNDEGDHLKAETINQRISSDHKDVRGGSGCSPCCGDELPPSSNTGYSTDNANHTGSMRRHCNVNGLGNSFSPSGLNRSLDVEGSGAKLRSDEFQRQQQMYAMLCGMNGSDGNGGERNARCSSCGRCGGIDGRSISEEISRGFQIMERNLKYHIDSKIDLVLAHLNERLNDIIK